MNYKEKINEFIDKINAIDRKFDFVYCLRPMTEKSAQSIKLFLIYENGANLKILFGTHSVSIVKETDFEDTYKHFYFNVVKFFLSESESVENLDNISAEKLVGVGLEKMKTL